MGWKTFSILVKPATEISHEVILKTLGFSDFRKIDDQPYEVAIYPDTNKIYIGNYQDTLLISEFNLPELFFSEGLSETENNLINLFPDAEIGAVSLHSGTNYWAYAIINNGKKIRARMGDSDNGTTLDYGEPLEEEIDLLSKSYLDKNGNRLYVFEDHPDELYTEDQVGENFVFEIYKRFTGESLDSNDDLLFDTILSGYQISKARKTFSAVEQTPVIKATKAKSWWKFW